MSKNENSSEKQSHVFKRRKNGPYKIGRAGLGRPALREPVADELEEGGTEESGAGDGQDPGVYDAAGDAPADGGEAASSTDADDGARDGVGGADGDAEDGVRDEGEAAGGFRSKAPEGSEFGDALAHGFDNAPSPGHGAAAHGQVAADDDPVGNGEGLE